MTDERSETPTGARRAAQRERNVLHDLAFDLPLAGDPDRAGISGTFDVTPDVLVPGSLSAGEPRVWSGVLATVADVAMGSVFSHSADVSTIALTIDLVVRTVRPIGLGTHDVDVAVLKAGRTLAIAETVIRDASGTLAHSVDTFMPLSFDGPLSMPEPAAGASIGGGTLDEPFIDALGIVVERPGVATVDRGPYTLQPAGTIQGGVVCTLAEVAAASLLGGAVVDLDVRFLGQVRTGPARALAERLDDSTARVVVTDDGRDDGRPTAFAVARRQPLA